MPFPFFPHHAIRLCHRAPVLPLCPGIVRIPLNGYRAAGRPKGPLLQHALKLNAGKRPACAIILRRHGNDDRAVGVFPVPAAVAHAVHRKPSGLAGSVNHVSARTHTEGIHAPSFRGLRGELIGGRRQSFRSSLRILGQVDQLLGMFHPKAHGKGLRFHGNSFFLQHGEGIPGAVSDGQHHGSGVNALPIFTDHAAHPAAFDHKLRHSGRKAHLAAPGKDPLPHVLYHPGQHVRSHMGPAFIPDLLRRAVFHKDFQDLGIPAVLILHQRVQLAVGKGACASLSELHVGIRRKHSRFPELLHPSGTAFHVLSPFQKQRPVSRLCKQISAEKPRRTGPDDERPFSQNLLPRLRETIAHLGRRSHIRILPAG